MFSVEDLRKRLELALAGRDLEVESFSVDAHADVLVYAYADLKVRCGDGEWLAVQPIVGVELSIPERPFGPEPVKREEIVLYGEVDRDRFLRALTAAVYRLLDLTELRHLDPEAKREVAEVLAREIYEFLKKRPCRMSMGGSPQLDLHEPVAGLEEEDGKVFFSLNVAGARFVLKKVFSYANLPYETSYDFLYTLMRELHSRDLELAARNLLSALVDEMRKFELKLTLEKKTLKEKIAI